MDKSVYPYFDMYSRDGSNISFERWTDSRSVDMHRHEYYELLFVGQGSCRHMYNSTETLLIQGDVVIVAAHRVHGFSLSGQTLIYNCQFLLESLDERVVHALRGYEAFAEDTGLEEDANSCEEKTLLTERETYYHHGQLRIGYELNSIKQGVVHLNPMEIPFVKSVLQHGVDAQESTEHISLLMKQKYLEVFLLELTKAMGRQNQMYAVCSKSNQKAVADVLMLIEEHLDETLDFNEIAREYSFSPNYFRKIFKDITGFSPITYVNRLRIVRACEYIQRDNMPIREAAERVGIYDLNYFSRLFKKIMGCAPSKM